MLTLGVIADTHLPDRARNLHPAVLPTFEKANVAAILHAGDMSIPRALGELAAVAPVYAVRGNRDWLGFGDLPMTRVLTFEQVRIGMTHGHGGWGKYLVAKVKFLLRGPQPFRITKERALRLLPDDVDVVIFGHNHSVMNFIEDGKLIFNPGSACCQIPRHLPPSVGLLHIDGDKVEGEIVDLA
ncbi:MAG: YfcE family phosphodiesterase [Anaerolineae bacterium]|nr:YfcE family phosphodiesterase [Anaerolineae bacterium]